MPENLLFKFSGWRREGNRYRYCGTTEMFLEEQINLNGILLNIIDTAGIRDTEDVVEKNRCGNVQRNI